MFLLLLTGRCYEAEALLSTPLEVGFCMVSLYAKITIFSRKTWTIVRGFDAISLSNHKLLTGKCYGTEICAFCSP